jgi:hypothetical protein
MMNYFWPNEKQRSKGLAKRVVDHGGAQRFTSGSSSHCD